MDKKNKYEFEFIVNASPSMIYQYLTSASALSQWFADDVVYKAGQYIFIWGDQKERAKKTKNKRNERVRFQWLDEDGNETDYYTDFRINVDELTKDVSLIITDFSEDDEEEVLLLWENQIEDLKHILGVH